MSFYLQSDFRDVIDFHYKEKGEDTRVEPEGYQEMVREAEVVRECGEMLKKNESKSTSILSSLSLMKHKAGKQASKKKERQNFLRMLGSSNRRVAQTKSGALKLADTNVNTNKDKAGSVDGEVGGKLPPACSPYQVPSSSARRPTSGSLGAPISLENLLRLVFERADVDMFEELVLSTNEVLRGGHVSGHWAMLLQSEWEKHATSFLPTAGSETTAMGGATQGTGPGHTVGHIMGHTQQQHGGGGGGGGGELHNTAAETLQHKLQVLQATSPHKPKRTKKNKEQSRKMKGSHKVGLSFEQAATATATVTAKAEEGEEDTGDKATGADTDKDKDKENGSESTRVPARPMGTRPTVLSPSATAQAAAEARKVYGAASSVEELMGKTATVAAKDIPSLQHVIADAKVTWEDRNVKMLTNLTANTDSSNAVYDCGGRLVGDVQTTLDDQHALRQRALRILHQREEESTSRVPHMTGFFDFDSASIGSHGTVAQKMRAARTLLEAAERTRQLESLSKSLGFHELVVEAAKDKHITARVPPNWRLKLLWMIHYLIARGVPTSQAYADELACLVLAAAGPDLELLEKDNTFLARLAEVAVAPADVQRRPGSRGAPSPRGRSRTGTMDVTSSSSVTHF